MSREKEGYREALDRLSEKYPGREFITRAESCKKFPARHIGRRALYRWYRWQAGW